MDTELKTVLDGISGSVGSFDSRLKSIQQQVDAIDVGLAGRVGISGGVDGGIDVLRKSFEDSADFAKFVQTLKGKAAIQIGDLNQIPLERKLLVGSTMAGTAGVIAPERINGIVPLAQRRLFMRDLLYRGGKVSGNTIYYIKEATFVNAAAPQAGEGSLKAETTNTFTTVSHPIQTLSHWLGASRQVVEDMPLLLSFIQTKLLFGLRFIEEVQILSGDGTGNNLFGLLPAASAFNTSLLGGSFTKLDVLRRALEQVELADEVPAGFFVLNPADVADIDLLKSTLGEYLVGSPGGQDSGPDTLWGRPVIKTTAMTAGTFLCGSSQSAELFDRMDALVELSYEDRDNFIRNAVTLLCEERTVLAIYRPAAFVTGSLTSSPL